jgi:hypothetical protein
MKYLLDNWNPDDTTIPPFHFNSLCYFDYNTEKQKAFNYRDAEVPFIVYNVPEIEEVVERWSDLEYLQTKIGHGRLPTETSLDNHFMYYVPPDEKDRSEITDSKGNPWVEPTKEVLMSYSKWLEMAVFNHFKPLEKRKHAYFRVSADDQSHWLFQELPFFQPKESLFMVDPTEQAGIHCRFGMNRLSSSLLRYEPMCPLLTLNRAASSQRAILMPVATMPSPSLVSAAGSSTIRTNVVTCTCIPLDIPPSATVRSIGLSRTISSIQTLLLQNLTK